MGARPAHSPPAGRAPEGPHERRGLLAWSKQAQTGDTGSDHPQERQDERPNRSGGCGGSVASGNGLRDRCGLGNRNACGFFRFIRHRCRQRNGNRSRLRSWLLDRGRQRHRDRCGFWCRRRRARGRRIGRCRTGLRCGLRSALRRRLRNPLTPHALGLLRPRRTCHIAISTPVQRLRVRLPRRWCWAWAKLVIVVPTNPGSNELLVTVFPSANTGRDLNLVGSISVVTERDGFSSNGGRCRHCNPHQTCHEQTQ